MSTWEKAQLGHGLFEELWRVKIIIIINIKILEDGFTDCLNQCLGQIKYQRWLIVNGSFDCLYRLPDLYCSSGAV